MYENEAKMPAAMGQISGAMMQREDITVRENIDRKIEYHKAQIVDLEKSREQLAPLLDMRIDLLRQAMMIGR